MTDLIEIKKENGRVIVVNTILSNMNNNDVLEYVKGRYSATMNYQKYGFDKPLYGIGFDKGCIAPADNSDKFFGRGDNGLIILCPNKLETESYGVSNLYLMYDDKNFSEEIINF